MLHHISVMLRVRRCYETYVLCMGMKIQCVSHPKIIRIGGRHFMAFVAQTQNFAIEPPLTFRAQKHYEPHISTMGMRI
jgi:hypothetical protein